MTIVYAHCRSHLQLAAKMIRLQRSFYGAVPRRAGLLSLHSKCFTAGRKPHGSQETVWRTHTHTFCNPLRPGGFHPTFCIKEL